MYPSTMPPATRMLASKLHPSSRLSSFPIAYREIPDENTVMTANETAFTPRVFSSNRSFRYSGTDRAREP